MSQHLSHRQPPVLAPGPSAAPRLVPCRGPSHALLHLLLLCMPDQHPPTRLSQPNTLSDSSEMIKFFPQEISCLKWQCWAAIRLRALMLLLDRGGVLPLLGRTSARELCQDAQELLSGPMAAVLGCSHTLWQELAVCGGDIHPEWVPQAQGLRDNVLTLPLPPKVRMQHRRSLRLCCPWRRERDVPLGTKHPANATPRGKEAQGNASTKVKQTKQENAADTPLVHFVLGLTFIPR